MVVIQIEGVPGVGKTTFSNILSSLLNYKLIEEFVPLDHLSKYLNNIKDETMLFNMRMFNQKLFNQLDAKLSNKGIIIDRGIRGNECFSKMHIQNNLLNEDKWNEYKSNYTKTINESKSDYIIYLKASPETCLRRCNKRNRQDEKNKYKIDYFNNLVKIHNEEFDNNDTIVIDWNNDLNTFELLNNHIIKIILSLFSNNNKVVIEGNIGVGKTTFINSLTKCILNIGYSCEIFPEPVFDTIDEFLENQTNNDIVFKFQKNTRMSRYNSLNKKSTSDYILYDRGLIGDECFAQVQIKKGMINNNEWKEYKNTFKEINENPLIIYLKSKPRTSYDRCLKRCNNDISKYNIKYFNDLNNEYDKQIIKNDNNYNIINIEWDDYKSQKDIDEYIKNNIIKILCDL